MAKGRRAVAVVRRMTQKAAQNADEAAEVISKISKNAPEPIDPIKAEALKRLNAEKQAQIAQADITRRLEVKPEPTIVQHELRQRELNEAFGAKKVDGVDIKQNTISQEQLQKNDALKEELKKRKLEREAAAQQPKPTEQEIRQEQRERKKARSQTREEYEAQRQKDRQANAKSTDERDALGLRGQSKAEYDTQVEATRKAQQAQKEFDAAQATVENQRKPLIKRKLGEAMQGLSNGWQATKDIISGATRNNNADFAQQFNKMIYDAGGSAADYIDVRGAGKLNKEYGSAKDAFDAKFGQKGMTAPNGTNPADVAEGTAKSGVDLSAIVDWAEKNPLIVAGALAGGAILLTDD